MSVVKQQQQQKYIIIVITSRWSCECHHFFINFQFALASEQL
jgi:hypothetical protein